MTAFIVPEEREKERDYQLINKRTFRDCRNYSNSGCSIPPTQAAMYTEIK